MSKPDLMICWIKHADYPIFRETLRKHRDFFGKIVIYWSEHFRDIYFDEFIQKDLESLGNIEFLPNIEYKYGQEDWRNVATNYMLKYTDSDWICSVEQDWFSSDWDKLLEVTSKAMENNDFVGWQHPGGYIHPGYWFIKRELLERTNKDFSARDGQDHFGWITQDALKLGVKLFDIDKDGGLKCDIPSYFNLETQGLDAMHMGGVNQNYLAGLTPNHDFHRADIFMVYNYWCRKANVIQDPRFTELSLEVEKVLRKQFPDLDLENSPWAKFFK